MGQYLSMLEEGFAEVREWQNCPEMSRLCYLSDHIFNFTTYDDGMSELFASKALEVCNAISAGTTFKYIDNQEQYQWYLLMCNMPFFEGRLEWGTSIRGAWWCTPIGKPLTFCSDGLWLNGQQVTEVAFTVDQWKEFITDLLAFSCGSISK